MSYSICIIEGNIGAGKTTCMEIVKQCIERNSKSIRCIIVREPTEEWIACKNVDGTSHLEAFYNNSRQESFSFQLFTQMTRLAAIKNVVDSLSVMANVWPCKHTIILMERSVASGNAVFGQQLVNSRLMSKCENDEIKRICSKLGFLDNKTRVDTLFLTAEPSVCMERIKQRNREGETVNLELLDELDKLYNSFEKAGYIHVIDCNQSLSQVTIHLELAIEKMMEYM